MIRFFIIITFLFYNTATMVVTIPPGIYAGQLIHVAAPDGRKIQATVPSGMQPGQSFRVSLPALSTKTVGAASSQAIAEEANPLKRRIPPPSMADATPASSSDHAPVAVATPMNKSTSTATVPTTASMTPTAASLPFSQALSQPLPTPTNPNITTATASSPWTCSTCTYSNARADEKCAMCLTPNQGSVATPNHRSQTATFLNNNSNSTEAPTNPSAPQRKQHKLMLVKVPLGTTAGTVLHVAVPGEPGRLIAATVPAGATTFHVAYASSPSKNRVGSHSIPHNSMSQQQQNSTNLNSNQ